MRVRSGGCRDAAAEGEGDEQENDCVDRGDDGGVLEGEFGDQVDHERENGEVDEGLDERAGFGRDLRETEARRDGEEAGANRTTTPVVMISSRATFRRSMRGEAQDDVNADEEEEPEHAESPVFRCEGRGIRSWPRHAHR